MFIQKETALIYKSVKHSKWIRQHTKACGKHPGLKKLIYKRQQQRGSVTCFEGTRHTHTHTHTHSGTLLTVNFRPKQRSQRQQERGRVNTSTWEGKKANATRRRADGWSMLWDAASRQRAFLLLNHVLKPIFIEQLLSDLVLLCRTLVLFYYFNIYIYFFFNVIFILFYLFCLDSLYSTL